MSRPVKNAAGRYDNVDFSKAAGYQYPVLKCSYNRRDVLLFANAIGCTADELHFLYELHPRFSMFPTFPINLLFKQTDQDVYDFGKKMLSADVPGTPPFDMQNSVDGERGIEIVRPLPVTSDGLDLEIHQTVLGVYDKGGHMVLEAEQQIVDARTGTVYTRMTSSAFGLQQGGYGGPRGPKPGQKTMPAPLRIPARRPDAVARVQTTPQTALLYRLCGDYNPLHADDAYGRQAGFRGAILQGLGTWNLAAHAVLRTLAGSDPARLRAFGARFKSVVYPGDALETRMWIVGPSAVHAGWDDVAFETVVVGDGRVALSNGYAQVKGAQVRGETSAETSRL